MAPGTHIESGIPQSNYDGSSVCNQYCPPADALRLVLRHLALLPGQRPAARRSSTRTSSTRAAPPPARRWSKAILMNSASYMTGVGANDTPCPPTTKAWAA